MGICNEDKEYRKNTWGNNKQNEPEKGKEQNNPSNEDIINQRNKYYESKEFKQKAIFKDSSWTKKDNIKQIKYFYLELKNINAITNEFILKTISFFSFYIIWFILFLGYFLIGNIK